jgi:hypothetical protein
MKRFVVAALLAVSVAGAVGVTGSLTGHVRSVIALK